MADPIRAAAERLLQQLELHAPLHLESAKSDLRAALDTHASAAPPASDGEREERDELADAMKREASAAESAGHLCFMEPMDLARAATLLRQPAPAPAAVPAQDLLLEWLQQREPWATWMRPGGCLESAHFELVTLLQDAIAAANVGVPNPEQPPQGGEVAE